MHQSKPTHSLRSGLTAFFAPEFRAWRGEARLSAVFWVHGVLVSSVLITLFATSIYRGQVFLEQALLIGFGFYTAWVLVSIWRCSSAAEPFWGVLAKLLTVPWAANAALVVFFLQLELWVRYAGK
ncbi:MAG: hypothetical protein Q8L54_07065 [Devosia sp.]|nr:hypothetical protein [Devosia sp.]